MEPEPEPVTEPQEPEDSIKNAVGYTKAVADATKLAEEEGIKDAVLVGLDMAKDGGLMKDMLGLGDSGPSGKLSSTERTAKQKAKLQRGLLREATQSAQAMAKTNAAARAQWAQSPVALTAPPLPELRQAHCDYLARLTGDPTVDARDGQIAGRVKGRVMHKKTPMKAVGAARKNNRKRLALSARLDKKLRDAATDCMTKMLTSEIVRQKSPWQGWGWIKGTHGHVEFHAMWRGPDASSHNNFCAFNVVYEDGHNSDPEYICGLAELSRPSTCFARWTLLKWGLDIQLLDALLERIAEKDREAGRVPRCLELGDMLAAVNDDHDRSGPETKRLEEMLTGGELSDYERVWLERESTGMEMTEACALAEKDEAKAGRLFGMAVHSLSETLASAQGLLRRLMLEAKVKATADAAA